MLSRRHLLAASTVLLATAARAGQAVSVVAAEAVYADIARQVGGPDVAVKAILTSPDQDPHLFEADPATARAIADASLVIVNGAGYDPWADQLLKADPRPARRVIRIDELLGAAPGGNPHLWYDPLAAPRLAQALAQALGEADPALREGCARRLAAFEASLAPIEAKLRDMRGRYAGRPVTATEPVFGLMVNAVGLVDRNERFQLAIMNDAEPSASDVAALETDLREHRVDVLIYNSQATEEATQRLLALAGSQHIPVVGVTETLPVGLSFQGWVLGQLAALDEALSKGAS